MAVTSNSNSYFICNLFGAGGGGGILIAYLGICISQKEIACYCSEMLYQSVDIFSENISQHQNEFP